MCLKLIDYDFEVILDKRLVFVEKTKSLIIELIQKPTKSSKINLSDYLEENLNKNYSVISNLFSQEEGITIEKFCILMRIEKAKELLSYDEMSISEIADYLGYSSTNHLSNQFKKVTEMSPSEFKNQNNIKLRKSIHKII